MDRDGDHPSPKCSSVKELLQSFCDFFTKKIVDIRSRLNQEPCPPHMHNNNDNITMPLALFDPMTHLKVQSIVMESPVTLNIQRCGLFHASEHHMSLEAFNRTIKTDLFLLFLNT